MRITLELSDDLLQLKNPSHPSEIIRGLYLAPLGLTMTEVAAGLGIP